MDYDFGMDTDELMDDVREGRIDAERLVWLIVELRRELQQAHQRIKELEQKLGQSAVKIDEPFSVDAEEKRQEGRGKKRRERKTSKRRGRRKTATKVEQAERTERVYPEGVSRQDCWLSHTRPVWRLEDGRAVLIAYEIYRGPGNRYGKIAGVLGRSEFGIEIVLPLAYQVYIVGLSLDKACQVLDFFQGLTLRKSQAEALLNQLSRHWEGEFEILCTLVANSLVVHADETSWSINSVWAFLSEKARLLFFGVHKDAATLAEVLDPDTFQGVVISDDAAVYANFTNAQKCWAHLLRKAIKLTLLEPDNEDYRLFTDRLLEIYRRACRLQCDKRYSDAGRAAKVDELHHEILKLCVREWVLDLDTPCEDGPPKDYRLLCKELIRVMQARQLFTFVTASDVAMPNGSTMAVGGTNNEAERTLRNPAAARKTGRTNKTLRGGRRQTAIVSVLESLRTHLPTFSLSSVIEEIKSWWEAGESCFARMLTELQIPPPTSSVLDAVLPLPPPKQKASGK